jgi:hypothetical protein
VFCCSWFHSFFDDDAASSLKQFAMHKNPYPTHGSGQIIQIRSTSMSAQEDFESHQRQLVDSSKSSLLALFKEVPRAPR